MGWNGWLNKKSNSLNKFVFLSPLDIVHWSDQDDDDDDDRWSTIERLNRSSWLNTFEWKRCDRFTFCTFVFPHSSHSSLTYIFCLQRFYFLSFRCSCCSLLDHIRAFRGKDKRINGKEKRTMYRRNKNHMNRCVARIASYKRKPKRERAEKSTHTQTHTHEVRNWPEKWTDTREQTGSNQRERQRERWSIENLFQSVAWCEVRTRSRIQLEKAKRFG